MWPRPVWSPFVTWTNADARLPRSGLISWTTDTLSHEPFPYKDIWDPPARVFDAFGFGRCMWGTDWTRAVYKQGVEAFRVTDRLSEGDRTALMCETLSRIYNWPQAQA